MAAGPFAGAAVLDGLDFSAALGARGLSGSVLAALFAPAWRWIFFAGVPLAILAALYTWAAASGWRREHRAVAFDLPGAALATLALGAGLLAVTSLGSEPGDGLPSPALTGLLSLAAAVLTAIRLRRAPEPFLDLRLLRRPVMAGAVLLSLLTGYALATSIVGGAVFVDRVRYGGPADQRLALGGLAAAMALGALVSGYALRRLGAVAVSVAGLAIGTVGLLLFSGLGPQGSIRDAAGGLALFGLGFGLTVTPRSAVAVEAAGRRAFGLAAAAVTVARMAGMALGLAVLTALGSDRIEALSVVLTDPTARDAVLPPELRGRPLQDGLVVDVLERWASEQAASILAGLFLAAAAIMALALLPALAMGRGRPLPGAAGERSDDDEDRRPLVAV